MHIYSATRRGTRGMRCINHPHCIERSRLIVEREVAFLGTTRPLFVKHYKVVVTNRNQVYALFRSDVG